MVALSGVLNSDVATRVNISIVRTFIKMRHLLASEESLTDKVGKLEKGMLVATVAFGSGFTWGSNLIRY